MQIIALLMLGACCAVAVAKSLSKDGTERHWTQHMGQVRDYACGLPQMQTVHLEDLGVKVEGNEALMPTVTVLRRCSYLRSCCGVGKLWGPAEQEVKELVFQVKDTVDITRPKWYSRVTAISHTRCHCVHDDTFDIPK